MEKPKLGQGLYVVVTVIKMGNRAQGGGGDK